MSAHRLRAEMLLQRHRPKEAIEEARLALAEDPEDAHAHATLALAFDELERHKEAIAEAMRAVSFAPEDPYCHRVLARALVHSDRHDDALASANEAHRLGPDDPLNHALRAVVQLQRAKWPEALEDAEHALALDPGNANAAALRAMALQRLARTEEALDSVTRALQQDPENALTHATQGWNLLYQGDPRAAQEHFREALRLDPELEYARNGMLEALRARNIIYRGVLRYYLWMSQQSRGTRTGVIIASLFASRYFATQATQDGHLSPVFLPLAILFYVFIYLTWTSRPLFNLLLELDPFGRHVLSRDQRRGALAFGAAMAVAAASGIWWIVTRGPGAQIAVLVTLLLSLCVAATGVRTGRARRILMVYTGVLGVLGGSAILATARGTDALSFVFFALGFFIFQFVANGLKS